MKLYKLENPQVSWDTYQSCVVCAKDETSARRIHPCPEGKKGCKKDAWPGQNKIKCIYIGEAAPNIKEGTVIEYSYCA